MYSRLKHWRAALGRFSALRISTKITALYAALLFVTLLVMSVLMTVGIYATFYHQAEMEIEISKRHTVDKLLEGVPLDALFWRDDPLLPGVVLRITDISGQVIFENDSRYPSIERVRAGIRSDPPFWANKNMFVSDFRNMSIYYTTENIIAGGHAYQLHFFRTITAEKKFLAAMLKFLFITNIMAFVIALLTGFLVSSHILNPIRAMTKAARRIEVERMDRRIEVPAVKDELAELAETLNHMLDRLQQGFAAQQRFVSDASHELRTPVTVLLGYSDLLSRWGRQDEEILDESISSIRSEAENMQQLIEKLLFLARADQKRQVLHKERLELSELLDDVMRKMKLVTKDHQVELLTNDEGNIYADEVTIRQMLRIFLDNAVKYTPKGGSIKVSSVRKDGCMKIDIQDSGIGIAAEDQDKIFERFYRVDSSRTKGEGSAGGTGLGLSIAQWIAGQHDIEINVSSELGKGTTFRLSVPLA